MSSYAFDILLIFVSSTACLYCWLLSHRLKKLQNLETGLGASILSLTDAIAKTNEAAHKSRTATEASIDVLQALLSQAQDTMPQLEARMESLRFSRLAAEKTLAALENLVVSELKPEIINAKQASRSLLTIVRQTSAWQRQTIANQKRLKGQTVQKKAS